MNSKATTEYKHSTFFFIVRTLLLLFLAFIFIFISYLLIIQNANFFLIAFIWLLYGLVFSESVPKNIRAGIHLFKNIPALLLTEDMLIDNLNMKKIKWAEISDIGEFYDVRSGSYIAIKVKNPEVFLKEEKSFYNRVMMKLSNKYWHGSFAVFQKEIKGKNQDLLQDLKKYFEAKK